MAILFLAALFSFRPITDSDIGFHLHGGKWIFEHHRFPDKDSYTYTVNTHDYVDLHWLFQIFVYGVYLMAGFNGLTILQTLVHAGLFALIWYWLSQEKIPTVAAISGLFLILQITEVRFNYRPEIITWLCLIFLFTELNRYISGSANRLWTLPLTMMVWVNVQGLFVLGLFVMGSYFLSESFRKRSVDRVLLKYVLLSCGAVLINPYFIRGALFPIELSTRLQSDNIFKHSISEFISPWSSVAMHNPSMYQPAVLWSYYGLSIILAVILIIRFRKIRLHEWAIASAFFYLSYLQFRNIPVFSFYAVWLGLKVVNDWNIFKSAIWMKAQAAISITLGAVMLLTGLRIASNAYYISDQRSTRFGLGLDRHYHADGASEFLIEHGITGRILNNLSAGNWLGWKLNQPVFIDGRLEVMKEQFFSEYQRSFQQVGLNSLIQKYKPEVIVFDYPSAMSWHEQLRSLPEWRLVYWDERSVVYLHSAQRGDIGSIRLTEVVQSMNLDTIVSEEEIIGFFLEDEESRWMSWMNGFWSKQEFPIDLLHMGIFAHASNQFNAAERLYFEFAKKAGQSGWPIYYNLGVIYYRQKKWNHALSCFERFLKHNPDDRKTQNLVMEIRKNSKKK